jgi:hypothetical protein
LTQTEEVATKQESRPSRGVAIRLIVAMASLIVLLVLSSFGFLVYAEASGGCVRNNHHNFPRCFNDKD